MILESALICLALNVYHEARGEPAMGRQAVALVTWNRAKQNRSNVCDVVTKPRQFSWTAGKLEHSKGRMYLAKDMLPKESTAWFMAILTARQVISGETYDLTKGATHFHATYVTPKWRLTARKTLAVGKHIFYRFK